ncbi:unnamed protein product [Fraxinus pennsylvanica]|uniref:Uncharacterized protein n=1 Tax=Fraxinus pennsylvanica TaxID=56036 RepID=A0AAD2E3I3_9LAMI|nr:unnamed protein product [Fraxinus pennsylvanica]
MDSNTSIKKKALKPKGCEGDNRKKTVAKDHTARDNDEAIKTTEEEIDKAYNTVIRVFATAKGSCHREYKLSTVLFKIRGQSRRMTRRCTRKNMHKNTKGIVSTIGTIPIELASDIMARVAANSLTDIANVKLRFERESGCRGLVERENAASGSTSEICKPSSFVCGHKEKKTEVLCRSCRPTMTKPMPVKPTTPETPSLASSQGDGSQSQGAENPNSNPNRNSGATETTGTENR